MAVIGAERTWVERRVESKLAASIPKSDPAMRLALAVATISALLSTPSLADRAAYSGRVDLTAALGTLSVRHRHDWSKFKWQLRYSESTPYGVEANVSSLEFSERGKPVVTVTSPPLTYLCVTDDARYVVGLSSIKLANDVQLIVLDRNANVLLRRHISSHVYRLAPSKYATLRAAYPETFRRLDARAHVTQVAYAWSDAGFVYLDVWLNLSGSEWPNFFHELFPSRVRSPWSANFGESVTNSVRWYDVENPAVRIVEDHGRPERIEIRDPEGVVMYLPFHLLSAD